MSEKPDSSDSAERCWLFISLMSLTTTLLCIIVGREISAVASAIVFATAIWGYHHRV